MGPLDAIQKTKDWLAQALVNPPWKRLTGGQEPSESASALSVQRQEAFLEQHLGYLASGDAILAAEALVVLAAQLDEAWPRERRRRYQALLEEIGEALGRSESLPGGLIERCRELLKLEPAMWAFLRHEGVEPTNNAAERALRPAVIWRKTSYGTDSEAGSRFVANVMSVVATCRQQGKNVLEFLTACCQADLKVQPPPSLLPA